MNNGLALQLRAQARDFSGGGGRKRWGITIRVSQVLSGLPEFPRPLPFPVPLGVTKGLLLPDLLVREGRDAALGNKAGRRCCHMKL